MERSQSYTSFETTGTIRQSQLTNNLSKNKFQHSNSNNDISNYYKNKFASTSSLNLRNALELRQTQLQLQKQQQQEQLQRQQWQLLYEQRRQQELQQQHQQYHQQQIQSLQHAASISIDQLDAPLYLSTLNNLQLMQVHHRQKMFQRQKSTVSNDEMDFQHDEDDDDENYGIVLRKHVYETIVNNDHNNNQSDSELTSNAQNKQPIEALPQKLLHFQRQRPHSEAAINYRLVALSPVSNVVDISTAVCSTPNPERRRLQQGDQSLSFDSAISSTTLNSSVNSHNNNKTNGDSNTVGNMSPLSARHPHFGKLKRDNSLHSDSSRYSSVDSLLEARKPDPEAILINLGFGPVVSENILSRIPKRFLKPSQVRGIDTDAFIRRLQLANSLADHSVLGYRGLIGNPDLPPSTIVAKIMQRFEVNERKKSMGSIEQTMR